MLRWLAIFLLVAVLAATFGYGAIATDAVGVARVLFVVFLAVDVALLLRFLGRRQEIPPGA